MALVEKGGVATFDVMHSGRQIRIRSFQKNMKMIPHQHDRIDSPSAADRSSREKLKPGLPVDVVFDDVPLFNTTVEDVIDATRDLDPQSTGHVLKTTSKDLT